MKQQPLLILLVLSTHLIGCAASNPNQIATRSHETPKPHPEAVSHYIDAKFFELKEKRTLAIKSLQNAIAIDSTSATLYSALGRNLNHLKRYGEAMASAKQAVRLEPNNLENRWLLFHTIVNGPKDTSSAVAQLQYIAQNDPNPLRAYDQLQQIYTAQHRRKDVLQTLKKISTLSSLNSEGKLRVADHFIRHQAPAQAETIYRELLSKNPHKAEIWFRLGSRILTRGDTLNAAKIFRKGLRIFNNRIDKGTAPIWGKLLLIYDSDTNLNSLLSETSLDTGFVKPLVDVFLGMARRSVLKEDPEKILRLNQRAEYLLNFLIQTNPNHQEHLGKKAGLLLRTNRSKEARAAFELAFQQNFRAEYMLGIGHSYLAEEQMEKALQIFQALYRQAPVHSPLYPNIVFELGRAYTNTKRFSDARSIYKKAAKAYPNSYNYSYEIGRTYVFEENWKNAIPIFENLVEKTENTKKFFRQVLFELGHCYERTSQFDNGVEIFQRLLTLDPEDHKTLNYLGYMLAEKGVRLSEAEQLIERALKAEPENSAYLDSMGWVYYQQGRYTDAIKFLESALEKEEEKLQGLNENIRFLFYEELVVIYNHAGDAARALGDLNKARQHWERALEFDPRNKTIQKKLQSFPGRSPLPLVDP